MQVASQGAAERENAINRSRVGLRPSPPSTPGAALAEEVFQQGLEHVRRIAEGEGRSTQGKVRAGYYP